MKALPPLVLSDDDLAYIAGYLDGEGCFTVTNGSKIVVTCSTTHKPTIEWLHATLGGNFSVCKPKKSNHRHTYRWAVVGRQAKRVCESVAIHLKEKAQQAAALIYFQQLVGLPLKGRCVAPEVLAERVRMKALIVEMKGRIRE